MRTTTEVIMLLTMLEELKGLKDRSDSKNSINLIDLNIPKNESDVICISDKRMLAAVQNMQKEFYISIGKFEKEIYTALEDLGVDTKSLRLESSFYNFNEPMQDYNKQEEMSFMHGLPRDLHDIGTAIDSKNFVDEINPTFKVGAKVSKKGGDYRFDGTIVGVFVKLSGKIRYAVEDDRGVLHIYSIKNLIAR